MIALATGVSGCEVFEALEKESERNYINAGRTSYYSGGNILDLTTEDDDKDEASKKKRAAARGAVVGGLDALRLIK